MNSKDDENELIILNTNFKNYGNIKTKAINTTYNKKITQSPDCL